MAGVWRRVAIQDSHWSCFCMSTSLTAYLKIHPNLSWGIRQDKPKTRNKTFLKSKPPTPLKLPPSTSRCSSGVLSANQRSVLELIDKTIIQSNKFDMWKAGRECLCTGGLSALRQTPATTQKLAFLSSKPYSG